MVSPVDEKTFGRIGGAVDVMERMGRKIPGMGLAEGLRPGDLAAPHNWAIDSAWAYDEQNPVRGRKLIYIVFFTFFAIIIWASFAPLDEVVSGSGKAVASEGTQVIQSVDGGMVTKSTPGKPREWKRDIIISLTPSGQAPCWPAGGQSLRPPPEGARLGGPYLRPALLLRRTWAKRPRKYSTASGNSTKPAARSWPPALKSLASR